MAQLIETALQEESEIQLQRFKKSLNWASPGYSGYCRMEHQPHVKKEVINAFSKVYDHQCAGNREMNYRKRPVCNKCNKIGHIARNCRSKSLQGN